MYKRLINLPKNPSKSLFLWGPRQSGKTTLLKKLYPDAIRIDLLRTDQYLQYLERPSLFRERIAEYDRDRIVVVDEIQKVPALLDEIHYLIQEEKRCFVLCGSNARKVRRGHANLLGGRAHKYELFGLSGREIGADFDIGQFCQRGPLPDHYQDQEAYFSLKSYVEDYLREEILEEGLVRKLPAFADFLRLAAIGDTEVVNVSNIAREAGAAATTVREHYQILADTLMGAFLPAYTHRPKRRTVQAPKFYFRDVGVVNHLARRNQLEPGSPLFGHAFENWVFHELSLYSRYSKKFFDLSYWRLSSGTEVDFVLGQAEVAVESKAKKRITPTDLKGLIQFKRDFPKVKKAILVCMEPERRRVEDISIVPHKEFLEDLWEGRVL